MLAHMEPAHFDHIFVLIAADLTDDLSMDIVNPDDLPDDWRTRYEDEELQQIGDDWLNRAESVALSVPFAVVPTERSVILNPEHIDFRTI